MAVGNLVANLSVNSAPFKKGLKGATGSMKSFAKGMGNIMKVGAAGAIAGATVALGGMIKQMKSLDEVAKLSARSGFSAKTIAGMGFAAEQTGSSVGAMNKSFDKFNRSMGEASTGTGAASDALKDMGLNVDDIMSMNSDDRLLAVSDAIAGIEDPAKKAAAAADIFGRSGVELLGVLSMGSEGIKEFQAEADALGLGFDSAELAKVEEANDAINRIKRSFSGMFGAMAVEFAPTIKSISDGLLTVTQNFKATFGPIKTFVVSTFHTVQDAVADVGIVIGVLAADIGPAFEGAFKDIPKFAGAAFDWVRDNAATMIDNLIAMAKAFPGILDSIGKNLGEEFAFAVGLSDEKMQFDPLREFRTKKLTEFKMPEFSPETKGVLSDVKGALADAKKQRAAARAGGTEADTGLPKLDQFTATISQSLAGTTVKADVESFAGIMQSGSSEAFSLLAKSSQQMPQVKEQKETNKILRGMAKVMERQKERNESLQEVGIA